MENENPSAVDEFLGDLANNGSQDPFSGTPDDLFEAPTKPEKEEVVEEKEKIPFNKDPKIQRFIEKQVERKLSERTFEQPARESKIDTSESPYGDILKEIIGDDTPEKRNAIDKFNRTFLEREERITSSIREESNSERQAELQAEAEADDIGISAGQFQKLRRINHFL